MTPRTIPDETVSRLFLYLRALLCLAREGKEIVSSRKLAETCHIKPTIIRKDFSYFGEFGTRGVGYDVNQLIQEIRHLLNLDNTMKAALIGVGNIGRALLNYPGFEEEGFKITLAFDNHPDKIGSNIQNVPIEDVAHLEEKLQSEGIKLGIIAVPESAASEIAHRLAQGGVKAILSFAPCQLITSNDVQITCVDLATEMARLVYYL